MKISLESIAKSLPPPCYSTDNLLEAAGDKFSPALQDMVRRFGVTQRHSILDNYDEVLFSNARPSWAVRGTAMAVQAARSCLEQAACPADRIGLVIALTNTPSRLVPAMVSDLFAQMRELPRSAVNLSLQGQGCSPLLKAIEAARWYLGSNPDERVLIVCMESTTAMSAPLTASRYVAFTEAKDALETQKTVDVLHGFLFADGAVALLLQADGPGPSFGPIKHLTNEAPQDEDLGHIMGAGSDCPAIAGRPAYRLGPGITERGSFYAHDTVNKVLADEACPIDSPKEAQRVLIHTGSRKILDGICKDLEIDPAGAQVSVSYGTLAKYGNLTGASLGFMIADALPQAKGHILLVSFGLGFSASAGTLSAGAA